MGTTRRLPELLAPAGSFDKLRIAIHYGADAVYLGGKKYSLRARAANFDEAGLREAVAYAHTHKVKVYVTLNIFAHPQDLVGLTDYLLLLREIGVDGLIISDPGILSIARRVVPEIPIHLSTQANVTNPASVAFWAGQGVSRVNLARELTYGEINEIRQSTNLEVEIFVHGALCISYSGRCLLSTYFTGRDANQGDCAHPCRYQYKLVEEKRPGQFFPVEEDDHGTYIFNSKDLCLLNRLPALVQLGVDSIKIEGRVKALGYVGQVVRVYRAALDWLASEMAAGRPLEECEMPHYFQEEVRKIGTRGWTENFFAGQPGPEDMLHTEMRQEQPWVPAGLIVSQNPLLVELRNPLGIGEELEYLGPGRENIALRILAIADQEGNSLEKAHPGNRVVLTTDPPCHDARPLSLLRKRKEN